MIDKILLTELLLSYEFKFVLGQGRPKTAEFENSVSATKSFQTITILRRVTLLIITLSNIACAYSLRLV